MISGPYHKRRREKKGIRKKSFYGNKFMEKRADIS